MTVLITGANGFLGSHIVDQLLESNFKVLAGVRENSNKRYLEGKELKYFFTDLNDLTRVEDELLQYKNAGGAIDFLIHNAGITKANSEEEFMVGNAEHSKSFYELVLNVFPYIKKIVFISSMAAGGPGSDDMTALNYGYDENPMTPYGKSKLKAEEYLREMEGEVEYLIFRPTAIYGPRESKMLPMIKALIKGIEVEFSDKRQRLSFIHAEDLSSLIAGSLLSDVSNKTYLVSDGGYYTMNEYKSTVKNYLNLKTIRLKISPGFLKTFVGILNNLAALIGKHMHFTPEKVKDITALNWKVDTTPLKRDFNFEAKFDLKKGLEHTLEWYIREGWI